MMTANSSLMFSLSLPSFCLSLIFLSVFLSVFLYVFSLCLLWCVCACLTCRVACVCVCICVNMKGPNRKILLDMLCSVGVQRCLPPSPGSPPPMSNQAKPAGIGNTTIPPSALLSLCCFSFSSIKCLPLVSFIQGSSCFLFFIALYYYCFYIY